MAVAILVVIIAAVRGEDESTKNEDIDTKILISSPEHDIS